MRARRGFWRRVAAVGSAVALAASLSHKIPARAQEIRANTNKSAIAQKARTTQKEIRNPGVVQIEKLSMEEDLRAAQIAGMVKKSIGTKASKLSTNTMVQLYETCRNVFHTQWRSFGTNEMRNSWITIQHYLKSPRLRKAWLEGNEIEIQRIMEREKVMPAERGNVENEKRIKRIIEIMTKTGKMSKEFRLELLKIR